MRSHMIFSFEGTAPKISESAFVAPTAAIIGNVEIGDDSSVWFHCVLRGDSNFIRIGKRTNIQDGSVIHVNAGNYPAIIGDDVTVGHSAVVHACTLHDRAFVAIGSTVLDGAVIEEGGVLAAGSLLTPGKRIGRYELWQGSPAKLVRVLDASERAQKFDGTAPHYVELGARFRSGLTPL